MKHHAIIIVTLLLFALITACGSQDPTPMIATPDADTPAPTLSPTPAPTSTPTPIPPREITVCQAEEPNTLFLYGGPSRAARNVLEAIYDGPIDTQTYQFQPVILEKIPSLADGDADLLTVPVQDGDRVTDVNGLPVDLKPGVTILDAAGQETRFETGVVTMTQMVVTFTLRADVKWADGQRLTADDSRYSYELAGEFDSPTLRILWDRTLSYDAVDERTVVWSGLPGYRDTLYFNNFYFPLPRHVWGVTEAENLLSAEVAHRKPLGWGAFTVEEWVENERITLVRNPHYFRASEGLPYLDRVTFRFVPDLPQALDLLRASECDLITQDVIENGDLTALLGAADAGEVQLITSPNVEWEHMDFGIQPSNLLRRPDFFGDVRVRRAIAMCVNRERIAGEALPPTGVTVADSYVSAEHPLHAGGQLQHWSYNPSQALALLEEVGWTDEDGDGVREAKGVPNVAAGTPFSVTLLTTSEQPAREHTARILTEDLAACGIRLGVKRLPAVEFFADGPDGPIFGRQFDLALFSWLNGLEAPCGLYLSSQIPGPENWWATSNNSGYSSAEYDATCLAALDALPGTDGYVRFHQEAQHIFSQDLPALPLYFVPKLVAARPGVSGVMLDPTEYLEMWNIEEFSIQ
jgi:peptide/nickel transport system substrate-binding protein